MPYDKERVSRRLKSLRADKGWTQTNLAEAAGLSLETIAAIESTRQGMNLVTACKITDALDCTLERLVCRDNPE